MSSTHYVDVNRALELMEQEVAAENAAAIRDFIDHQAAEGISEVQQQRQVYSLRMLLTKFAPDKFLLRDTTEDELKYRELRLVRSSAVYPSTSAPFARTGATVTRWEGERYLTLALTNLVEMAEIVDVPALVSRV